MPRPSKSKQKKGGHGGNASNKHANQQKNQQHQQQQSSSSSSSSSSSAQQNHVPASPEDHSDGASSPRPSTPLADSSFLNFTKELLLHKVLSGATSSFGSPFGPFSSGPSSNFLLDPSAISASFPTLASQSFAETIQEECDHLMLVRGDVEDQLSTIPEEERLPWMLNNFIKITAELRHLDRKYQRSENHCQILLQEREHLQELKMVDKMMNRLDAFRKTVNEAEEERLNALYTGASNASSSASETTQREEETEQAERERQREREGHGMTGVTGMTGIVPDSLISKSLDESLASIENPHQRLKYLEDVAHNLAQQCEILDCQLKMLTKTKDLESHLLATQFKQKIEITQQECLKFLAIQSKTYSDHLTMIVQTENELRQQLAIYTEKFEQFQETLSKSNEVFSSFKLEMEKMTKTIKKLEKERNALQKKCEQADIALLDMAEERNNHKKEIEAYKLKSSRLECLCKVLQAEVKRNSRPQTPSQGSTQPQGQSAQGSGPSSPQSASSNSAVALNGSSSSAKVKEVSPGSSSDPVNSSLSSSPLPDESDGVAVLSEEQPLASENLLPTDPSKTFCR